MTEHTYNPNPHKIFNPVRVVNTHPDYPHIVERNSLTFIIPPKSGVQFRKVKMQRLVPKTIVEKDGSKRTLTKQRAATEYHMVAKDSKGKTVTIAPTKTMVGLDGEPLSKHEIANGMVGYPKLSWPVPPGLTPVVVKNSNYCDLPPDAALNILSGEFNGPNPETQQRDLKYHAGDIIPLSEAHELADAIYSGRSADLTAIEDRALALKALEADLQQRIEAKQKELADLGIIEVTGKQKAGSKGASTTPDSPNKPGA